MRRKITTLFLAICLVLGLAQATPAVVTLDSIGGPIVTLLVGEETMEVPMTLGERGWLLPAVSFVTASGSLTLNLDTDISPVDPVIAWGMVATNLAAVPVPFGFAVGVPVVMPALPTTVAASAVGGMTDLTGNGVAVIPTNVPSGLLQDNIFAGFTWSVGPAVAFPAGAPGAIYPYGPFAFGPAPGPLGGAGILFDSVGFTLTGFGDIASLTGFCSIVPIPVPPSAFLLGTGLLGLLGFGWRRAKG